MSTEFSFTGKLPQYSDIELQLYKNQNTLIAFDWVHIFRSYEYIPELSDFKFKCIFTINSKLEEETNLLTICTIDNNGIILDIPKDTIYIKINNNVTKNLKSYDSGIFMLDYSNNKSISKDYYRLCSGRWHLAISDYKTDCFQKIYNYRYTKDLDPEQNLILGITYNIDSTI